MYMYVNVICKFHIGLIKPNQVMLRTRSNVVLIVLNLRASKVNSHIWPEIKLVQEFMPSSYLQVSCSSESHKVSIKKKRTGYVPDKVDYRSFRH